MTGDENAAALAAVSAIGAGRSVDWAAIESSADAGGSSGLLQQLKIVESIAQVHRSFANQSEDATRTAALLGNGAQWGPLRIIELAGQGAFGDVYRAWDLRLDREVALKLLNRSSSSSASVGSDVIDEARLLARVRHPNVVTVYGADRIDGQVGLWMEFVRGRTLESVLRDHGPLSAREAALIGLDLCHALSAVHRAGLLHRDVKAQNVVREAGGRLVLMDFGTGREGLDDLRADVAGTPLYLAPEIFAGVPATTRSDIYSVGVLLYHLVTASYPVRGRTVADLREAQLRGERSWLRDERPDLPDAFVEAIERALNANPDVRFESAGAMEAALAPVVGRGDPAVAVSTAWPASARSRIRLPRSMPRRFWLAASAVTLIALALIGGTAWRDGGYGRLATRSPARPTIAVESPVTMRQIPFGGFSVIGGPSPDGKWFSFADESGNVAVFDLATGAPRRVTGDAAASPRASQFAQATAISPDDKYIAFGWSALDGQYELRIVDFDGTDPRVLLRGESIEYAAPIQWSRDGSSILALIMRPDHSASLALVNVDSGRVRAVVELGSAWPQYASLSPDGEFVVYDAPQRAGPPGTRDILIVRADGSDGHSLIEHPANDAQPVWSPDGRAVLFTSDRSGSNDIWSVSVDSGRAVGEPTLVHRNVGRMWLRGLTDSGSYFYLLTAGVVDVYEARLTGTTVETPAVLPTSYAGSNISSLWSPDGNRLAYASRRGVTWFDRGSTTLALRNVQTRNQLELAPAMNGFLLRSWSPDGRRLLVNGNGLDHRQGTYQIDVETGRVTPVQVDGSSARPDWLRDGRISYFNRASGAIMARDAQTGAEEVLFDSRTEGGQIAAGIYGRGYRISPDGQMLAYTTASGKGRNAVESLRIRALAGGAPRELARTEPPELLIFQDWTPDGSALLFTRWSTEGKGPVALWRVPIGGGDPQPLGLSMIGLRDVTVHPDGTRITFTAGWPENEIWSISNFLTAR
jgi:Tol biopolymer transport system component